MSDDQSNILKRALLREKEARKQAERILEDKSRELYKTAQELKAVNNKLEGLLDETSAELKGVFENIVDAFVLMDVEGNVLKLNEAAETLFGYTLEHEAINVTQLIFEEDYHYAMESYGVLMSKGQFKDYRARIVTKSKDIRWVHINASLLYDKSHRPIAAQGIVRDITEERQQSLVIEVLNNVAKSILGKMDIYDIAWEIVTNIATYLNTDDCIIYLVNHEKQHLEQIAVFGQKLSSYDKNNPFTLKIGEGIVGHAAQSGKAEIITDTSKDQRYVVEDDERLSEIVVPIINDGNVIALIDSEHADRNYFKKEHLDTLNNIANLVALQFNSAINLRQKEKTEALNRDLLKKLALSNKELQEYAHVVSHDLKSPLRSINALVNWIKYDNLDSYDETSLKNFDLVDTTLDKMEKLISGILLYSSIDAKRDRKEEVDLQLLVEELKQILFLPAHIEIEIENPLPIVRGDKIKLQQLFQNIISNAIEYNDKKKGLIKINHVEYNSYYQFSINDNGKGIEEKYHEKIFRIFHSLETGGTSSGIGLSIVKKIIDLYEGEIWLDSKLNHGTTFYFTLKKM